MYFHYPSWSGSTPDPSMVPPPPVIFKAYYFKSDKSSSAKRNRANMDPYADDDIGVDYGPEYVRPMSHPSPPDPLQKEETFEYWTYTRVYNSRPKPFVPPVPPLSHTRPWISPKYSNEYRYSQTPPHPHPQPQSQPKPQPKPQPPPKPKPKPHTKDPPPTSKPRTTWSTPESTKAWRARQKKLWEDWEKKSKEARQSRDQASWNGWAPRSSASKQSNSGFRDDDWGPRYPSWRFPSYGGWREGWAPPRAPSPAKSDGDWHDWHDRSWYASGRGYEHTGQSDDEGDEDWSDAFWPPPRMEGQPHPFATLHSEKKLSEAFASYCKTWETLLSSDNSTPLTFRNIPWPQYPPPRCVENIDTQNVQAFLKASGRPMKTCLREALLRFHPDKTALLLMHVEEKDKADVEAGCQAVARCLNQLMNSIQ